MMIIYRLSFQWVIGLVLFMGLGLSFSVQAQKGKGGKTLIHADQLFNEGKYGQALGLYQKVCEKYDNHPYAHYQLAETHRLLRHYEVAESGYGYVALRWQNEYPLAQFWYASMVKANGKCDSAILAFEKFIMIDQESDLESELYRAKAVMEMVSCERWIKYRHKHSSAFGMSKDPLAWPVSSTEDDYGPVPCLDDSVLLLGSTRGDAQGKVDDYSGKKMADMYCLNLSTSSPAIGDSKSAWVQSIQMLNTAAHEVAGSMTSDGKKFYFTRCGKGPEATEGEGLCAIYVSSWQHTTWSEPVKLNDHINPPNTWNAQPSVSADGKLLFFVSKRPGGLGMSDIYYSVCRGDDSWQPPVNLGDKINTLFTEATPYYDVYRSELYFSSNGHGGYGELDIFMTREQDGFSKIYHLPPPYNSLQDDMGLVVGSSNGFISSNRPSQLKKALEKADNMSRGEEATPNYGNGFDVYRFKADSLLALVHDLSSGALLSEDTFYFYNYVLLAQADKMPEPGLYQVTIPSVDSLFTGPVERLALWALVPSTGERFPLNVATRSDEVNKYKLQTLNGVQIWAKYLEAENITLRRKNLVKISHIPGKP